MDYLSWSRHFRCFTGKGELDLDDEAEYRRLYTKTLAEGFFFEVVERRNHQGFGTVNALIRPAAQTRLAQRPSPRL